MDNQSYRYSAFFKMYGDENLQVSFNLVENDPQQHLHNLNEFLGMLRSQGYSVEPREHVGGEEVHEVTGWVLGKTKKDELCAHLYGPEHLQWKIITVWQEDLEKLKVKIAPNLQPIIGSAPEREVAVRMKIFQPFPVGTRVILEPVVNFDGTIRTNEKGNVVKKFSRMYGQPKTTALATPADAAPVAKAAVSQGQLLETPVDEDFYPAPVSEIDSYAQIMNLLKVGSNSRRFVEWCRKTQESSKEVASVEQLTLLSSTIDEIVGVAGMPGAGDAVLSVLSGLDPIDLTERTSKALVTALLKWLVQTDANNNVNPAFEQRYAIAIQEIFKLIEKFWE